MNDTRETEDAGIGKIKGQISSYQLVTYAAFLEAEAEALQVSSWLGIIHVVFFLVFVFAVDGEARICQRVVLNLEAGFSSVTTAAIDTL